MERDATTSKPPHRRLRVLASVGLVTLVAGVIVIVALSRQGAPARAYPAPVAPGLSGSHPLDQQQIGELLVGTLACAACHAEAEGVSSLRMAAPNLDEVAWRVSPAFLRRFIADPAAAQPGTTMPQALTGASRDEREEIAEALVQFLATQTDRSFQRDAIDERDVRAGESLFHSVGCVACHAPRAAATPGAYVPTTLPGKVGLTHLPEKYSLASLTEFLHQPLTVRASGRMPDMQLSSSEAKSIASYLLGGDYSALIAPAHVGAATARDESLVEAGRAYFEAFDCSSCHALQGVERDARVDVGHFDVRRGCLTPRPARAPDYHLSDDQRSAIRLALTSGAPSHTADDQIALTLTAFNCIACHVRDDYGGVSGAIDPYFETSEPSLGDAARIPPPLTDVGAKLTPAWFHRVMFDGASVRPFMRTRMPQFGEANLAFLASLIEAADPAMSFDMTTLQGDRAREAEEAGRELLGTDGLGCVVCHNFNGKASPSFGGIDLITSTERLRPAWFSRFLIEPETYRPGIVMPESWPGSAATRTDILDGDTDAQVNAVWSFLSLGRTARDPKGIHSEPTILTVADVTRTYRGRSGIAGFRGIAVGFPSGLSYAFNANTGSLAGIWRGGFVRVRWDGQGAGDFDPAARAIALAQDVGFCRLNDDEAPWPLRPEMDEENPVNPDPLYPRNVGYRFKGYFFDDDATPTFMYAIGDVEIEDTSVAALSEERASLVRTIRFSAPDAETLYFRVLAGAIEEVSAWQFKAGGVQLTIPQGSTVLHRPVGDGQSEVILKLEALKGESTLAIDYELLH